jgi:hypothetical protein
VLAAQQQQQQQVEAQNWTETPRTGACFMLILPMTSPDKDLLDSRITVLAMVEVLQQTNCACRCGACRCCCCALQARPLG